MTGATLTAFGLSIFGLAAGALLLQQQPSSPPKPPTEDKPQTIARKAPPKEPMLTWTTLEIEEESPKRDDKLVLTDAEWKKRLDPEAYDILRAHGTEPAFCGVNLDQQGEGIYHCKGCNLELFYAENKFNSRSGWPSFYLPWSRKNVWFKTDLKYGMRRVEVLCSRCDGHLGHVFPDGPEPSGLRFCINGKAMTFKKFEN